jgi:pimeloyl-ACP methyl ester carboxylesterase
MKAIRRKPKSNYIIFLAIALIYMSEPGISGDVDAKQEAAKFGEIEWTDIPAELNPQKGDIKFGYLPVRENRHDPKNKNILRVAFSVIKSSSLNPNPDPVLYTSGGPGVISSVRATQYYFKIPFFMELLKDRDLILFEQRGAKYSIPNLTGPEIDDLLLNSIESGVNGQPEKKKFIETATKLRDRFVKNGIDLTAYNSVESAADIEDLRKALKIKKINLVGISYSARLMLEVYRYYPGGVRSLVLDSPLPPDASWNENSVNNYWSILDKLFSQVEKDNSLSTQFPALKSKFLKLIESADKEPLRLKTQHPLTKKPVTVTINGEGVFKAVCSYIGLKRDLNYFAASINGICLKNEYALKYFTDQSIAPADYSWGMVYSFWNNEEFPFEDFNKFANHDGVPVQLRSIEFTAAPVEIKDIWPRRLPDKIENSPVKGNIPVLILSGEYDPDTPVYFAKMIERHLSKSHLVLFPNGGHVQVFSQPGAKLIVRDFLNFPEKMPDTRCLLETK